MQSYTTIDEALSVYDEALDEAYGEPMGYQASRVLKAVDPIAYRCGFHDWLDGEGVVSDTLEGDWAAL
ncbi:MAG: hypothetical protein NVV57_10725 [Demequina sp.]|jgi:hypothetical protein|nr:hypothetical protein [Demequina sp.]